MENDRDGDEIVQADMTNEGARQTEAAQTQDCIGALSSSVAIPQ